MPALAPGVATFAIARDPIPHNLCVVTVPLQAGVL